MRQLTITGANSAVGAAILSELHSDSHASNDSYDAWSATAIVRSERAKSSLLETHPSASIAVIDYQDGAKLASSFETCDAVVHLPGVLIERKGSTYQQANVETARSVIDAAAQHKRAKFVLVSAVGADPDSSNRYYASKGEAEDLVRASGLDFSVIRAPLVLGRGTEGSAALERHVAAGSPRLLGGGRQLQQPIDLRDLARGCLRACTRSVARGQTLNLVGPESLPERELLVRIAQLLGKSITIGSVPVGVVRLAARLRALVAGPGFSSDAVDVICDGTQLDPDPAAEALQVRLTPLEQTLRDMCSEDV